MLQNFGDLFVTKKLIAFLRGTPPVWPRPGIQPDLFSHLNSLFVRGSGAAPSGSPGCAAASRTFLSLSVEERARGSSSSAVFRPQALRHPGLTLAYPPQKK